MGFDYDDKGEIQQIEQSIMDVQGVISGMIGSLRADVGFGKRTQTSADEITGYLITIDKLLDRI
jgi:hypothetical protein